VFCVRVIAGMVVAMTQKGYKLRLGVVSKLYALGTTDAHFAERRTIRGRDYRCLKTSAAMVAQISLT